MWQSAADFRELVRFLAPVHLEKTKRLHYLGMAFPSMPAYHRVPPDIQEPELYVQQLLTFLGDAPRMTDGQHPLVNYLETVQEEVRGRPGERAGTMAGPSAAGAAGPTRGRGARGGHRGLPGAADARLLAAGAAAVRLAGWGGAAAGGARAARPLTRKRTTSIPTRAAIGRVRPRWLPSTARTTVRRRNQCRTWRSACWRHGAPSCWGNRAAARRGRWPLWPRAMRRRGRGPTLTHARGCCYRCRCR